MVPGNSQADSRTVKLDEIGQLEVDQAKVLVCHQIPPRDVVRCAVEHKASQVIQDTNPHFNAELSSSIKMLDQPASFFDYPFSTILKPGHSDAETEKSLIIADLQFSQTSEKDATLDEVERAIVALARPQSLSYDVKLVADELFMNALYNAPVGPNRPKIERSVKIQLPPGKTCRMALGKDEERLVLLCEDSYGTLDIGGYLDRLYKCYDEGVKNAINWGLGGAGIGCYMIFESCMSIFLGVKPGQRTLVGCVFALGKGTRARQELSKSLHYTKT